MNRSRVNSRPTFSPVPPLTIVSGIENWKELLFSMEKLLGFASMAALHDMGGKDEQNAIETVIEQQADKKWKEQESGEGSNQNREDVK